MEIVASTQSVSARVIDGAVQIEYIWWHVVRRRFGGSLCVPPTAALQHALLEQSFIGSGYRATVQVVKLVD